jgi:hypothetical protein
MIIYVEASKSSGTEANTATLKTCILPVTGKISNRNAAGAVKNNAPAQDILVALQDNWHSRQPKYHRMRTM